MSRSALLAGRVTYGAPGQAVAEAWIVHVLTGGGSARSIYSTVTLELVASSDRWLLDEVRFEAGPTPTQGRAADRPDDLEARLLGFGDPVDELVP